jgi:uncharacterized membrane protein (UPF0136 family)
MISQITLGIYAVLLAVGGVLGFVRARSRASLIAGLVSAASAAIALALTFYRPIWGIALGSLLSITLFLFFGYRYAVRNRKFMPAGLLAIASLIVLGVMIFVSDWTAR